MLVYQREVISYNRSGDYADFGFENHALLFAILGCHVVVTNPRLFIYNIFVYVGLPAFLSYISLVAYVLPF